jgi:hypothetical protein
MMWLKRLFGLGDDPQNESGLDRYRALRQIGRESQLEIIKALPKTALPECAKKIGLVKAGTLIINQDDEIAIAYDYCLQHFRRAGKNPIERALDTPLEATAQLWLEALREAHFSAFLIESIKAHQGAQLRDLIFGETLELMDLGLASSGQPGLIVIGRILRIEGLSISSGTLIPVPHEVFERHILPVFEKFGQVKEKDSSAISSSQRAALEAQVIRIALHEAGEDNSFFTDME